MKTDIGHYVERLHGAIAALPVDSLERLGASLYRAYRNSKQVFIVGNGGSASTASHMAADLAKNTIAPNMQRFRITSLNDNVAILTALANDLGYENVFIEQLINVIGAGDVLIVISGSGNSDNVLRAMRYARQQCAEVVSLLGFDGGEALALSDVAIVVESDEYGVIEDLHLVINHILVYYFSRRLARDRPWLV